MLMQKHIEPMLKVMTKGVASEHTSVESAWLEHLS
jgi:hypothetical protein